MVGFETNLVTGNRAAKVSPTSRRFSNGLTYYEGGVWTFNFQQTTLWLG